MCQLQQLTLQRVRHFKLLHFVGAGCIAPLSVGFAAAAPKDSLVSAARDKKCKILIGEGCTLNMLSQESKQRFGDVATWLGLLKACLRRIQHLSNAQNSGIEDILALQSPTQHQLQAPLTHFIQAVGWLMGLSDDEMSAVVIGSLVSQLQVLYHIIHHPVGVVFGPDRFLPWL